MCSWMISACAPQRKHNNNNNNIFNCIHETSNTVRNVLPHWMSLEMTHRAHLKKFPRHLIIRVLFHYRVQFVNRDSSLVWSLSSLHIRCRISLLAFTFVRIFEQHFSFASQKVNTEGTTSSFNLNFRFTLGLSSLIKSLSKSTSPKCNPHMVAFASWL